MRILSLVLLLALPLAGCGAGSSADDSTSSDDTTSGDNTSDDVSVDPPDEGGPCPEGGVPPVEGADGIPENCEVLFEGCCYAEGRDACLAAGCGESCAIMESYPGQLSRCDDGDGS